MAVKENLLKDLDWVTEKISSQVWTLNLGTLGTTWSLLITTSVPDNRAHSRQPPTAPRTALRSRWCAVRGLGAASAPPDQAGFFPPA
jgi:hypothetical protein